MKVAGCLFSGLGLFVLAIAALLYVVEAGFLSHAVLTTGTVTSLDRSMSVDDNGYSYCPVFEFTTAGGQTVSYHGNVCSDPPAYKVGDRRELYYDPENVENVQMNNFWSKYVGVFVLGVIGLPFTLMGLVVFVSGMFGNKPRARQMQDP